MNLLPWILVAGLALALVLLLRSRQGGDRYPLAVDRLTAEVEAGAEVARSATEDPAEVVSLRLALSHGWRPLARGGEDAGEEAMQGLIRYTREVVIPSLEEALQGGGDARTLVESALDALADLEFYGRERPARAVTTENLAALVQEVSREFTRDTGIPVKFRGPDSALPVSVVAEDLRDALYLLLQNAGRYGGGQTIEVVAEAEGEGVRLQVRDRGPGFSLEALDRAFLPFWSSESDALGLGLPHARRVLEEQGAQLRIRNREEGGAEAEIRLRRGRS